MKRTYEGYVTSYTGNTEQIFHASKVGCHSTGTVNEYYLSSNVFLKSGYYE